MGKIRKVVLDVLKPQDPSIAHLASKLSDIEGVDGVNIVLYEVDRNTENIKITIEGEDLRLDEIINTLEGYGAVVHSIDMVAAGKKIIEEEHTPQD